MIFKKVLRSFFSNAKGFLLVFLAGFAFTSGGYLFFDCFFPHFAEKTLYPILSVSWKGLQENKWWKIFTFFLFDSPEGSISFGFLFSFFIKFYVLRFMALSLSQVKGFFSFLMLYIGSALLGFLFTLPVLVSFFPFLSFSNFTGPLYGLSLAWIMLHPNTRLFLFFRIPFRASSLFNWIFFPAIIFDIFEEKYIEALFYFGCTLFGYLYALIGWGRLGIFPKFHKTEKKLIEITYFFRKKRKGCQIYDFRSRKKDL